MEIREFEGKTEQEAIDKAIAALGLDREEIDVEILEARKGSFLFGGGKVKIRVHVEEEDAPDADEPAGQVAPLDPQAQAEFEGRVIEFLSGLLSRIGLAVRIQVTRREGAKIGLDIETEDSGLLIGKRGANLEAIQLLTNIVANRIGGDHRRVILDTRDYRNRRERNLVRLARAAAAQVRRTGEPRLLEAMNPFERRLVHTALSGSRDIETQSEGEGLYKRIRIQIRGVGREGPSDPKGLMAGARSRKDRHSSPRRT